MTKCIIVFKNNRYRISAIKRHDYYLLHHAIYCGYYSRAATNQRRRLLNSAWSTVYAQRSLNFRFSSVWYHHNHPEKMVGIANAITVVKDFAGHMSLALVPRPQI